ncbi:MAG: asparagine synthase (glutamine-hydrolyzing) [Acidimicrobiales bacterium]
MCGLVGIARRGDADLPLADGVLDSLAHRGPDDRGVEQRLGSGWAWTFGHTRLAINDLSSAGHQPMASEDGQLIMVFNGEIYNYPDLRRFCEAKGCRLQSQMDGEVILHLWALEGEACLARLNGIFALAMGDTRTGEVSLARDPLGVKPLFYHQGRSGALSFSSEIRGLRALGCDLGGPDLVGLAQFLSFLWIPDPRTPHARVSSVEPGTLLKWSAGRTCLVRYCPPLAPETEPPRLSVTSAVEQGEDLIANAVDRQMLSDVPVGLMASGGVDSSLLWWGARGGLERAYNISWAKEGDDRLGDDSAAVALCEQRFSTPTVYVSGDHWDQFRLPAGGDLLADPAYELTRTLARVSRADGCKVLLSGQGGDELFGGYRRHRAAAVLEHVRLPGPSRVVGAALMRIAGGSTSAEYLARLMAAMSCTNPVDRYLRLCTYSSAQERARVLDCTVAEVSDRVVGSRHAEVFETLPEGVSFLRKMMALDLRVYLPGLGLGYADRAGMEEGVEVRVPLLDLDLVRWSLQLPDSLLVGRHGGKWLAKQVAARHLPPAVVFRPKRGFGAPSGQVASHDGVPSGSRGFRQAAYFDRASMLVRRHLEAEGRIW